MSENSENSRYIPSAEMVMKASESLPPAETFRGEKYHATLNEDRLIEFKRLKLKGKKGRIYRWVYDGKIIVR